MRNSLKLQQRCACRGRCAEASARARYDAGVFPPLQPARRGAGAEPRQAAAKRHDGAGQLRPFRMPGSDAVAAAHPGDRGAELAADRRGLGLRRARRQVRSVLMPRPQPAGAKQANGFQRIMEEEDQQGDATDQPLQRVYGAARTAPIRIGEEGFGRRGEQVAHCGAETTTGWGGCQAIFPV